MMCIIHNIVSLGMRVLFFTGTTWIAICFPNHLILPVGLLMARTPLSYCNSDASSVVNYSLPLNAYAKPRNFILRREGLDWPDDLNIGRGLSWPGIYLAKVVSGNRRYPPRCRKYERMSDPSDSLEIIDDALAIYVESIRQIWLVVKCPTRIDHQHEQDPIVHS